MFKHSDNYTFLLFILGLVYLSEGLFAMGYLEPSQGRTAGVFLFVGVFVMTLCVVTLRLRESRYARMATRIMNVICFLLILGIPLGIYGFLKVDRRRTGESPEQEGSGHNGASAREVQPKTLFQRHGLWWVTSFCAPSILGAAMVQTALTFAPPRSNPISPCMYDLWISGAWVIAIGKLLLLAGIFLGVRLIWVNRARTRQSLWCILIMAVGVAAGIYGWILAHMLREIIKEL
jgi:hypothetical protein